MTRSTWEGAALRVLAAEGYVGPRHIARVRLLVSTLLRAAPAGPLLDAGCGFGTMAAALAEQDRTVFAFDIDRRRVSRARELARAMNLTDQVHLFVADATAVPLADGTFAGAGAGEVLEHIHDDAAAVRELSRVLQPDGALAMTVPAGANRYGPVDMAAGHYRRYDRHDLEALLSECGLRARSIKSWGFPFGRMYDWLAGHGGVYRREGGGRLRAALVFPTPIVLALAGLIGVTVPAAEVRASGYVAAAEGAGRLV